MLDGSLSRHELFLPIREFPTSAGPSFLPQARGHAWFTPHTSQPTVVRAKNFGRHEDPFFAAPALVHAAAAGSTVDLSGILVPVHSDDALDLTYVKDTGRAIALLQLADKLNHRTYNIGSGHATSNTEIIAAIRAVVPDFRIDLPAGSRRTSNWLDISRIHDDTGYQPEYNTKLAAMDDIAWLRAGNSR